MSKEGGQTQLFSPPMWRVSRPPAAGWKANAPWPIFRAGFPLNPGHTSWKNAETPSHRVLDKWLLLFLFCSMCLAFIRAWHRHHIYLFWDWVCTVHWWYILCSNSNLPLFCRSLVSLDASDDEKLAYVAHNVLWRTKYCNSKSWTKSSKCLHRYSSLLFLHHNRALPFNISGKDRVIFY